MSDWQNQQQSQRRFAHRGRKNGGRGRGEVFQPRNMLGRFTVRSAFLEKLKRSASQVDDDQGLWLEVHELVESQTGFLASFDFGIVSGVMVIAGSRKELRNIVEELEEEKIDEQISSSASDSDGDGSCEDAQQSGESENDQANNSFLPAPELDRPTHAFEKNTFRTPKWFAQWRGIVGRTADASREDKDNHIPSEEPSDKEDQSMAVNGHEDPDTAQADLDNKAHFEFSSATCRDFQATFTCPALGAREVAMQGWKITGKSSPATRQWTDFAP